MGDRSNINLVGNTTFGENVGSGTGVYKGKNLGNVLQLKTLSVTGTTMSITTDADNIYFSAATGGGGGGLTASNNGLCDNGTTVGLGGTLVNDTCIDGDSFTYGVKLCDISGFYMTGFTHHMTPYSCGCLDANSGSYFIRGCGVEVTVGAVDFCARATSGCAILDGFYGTYLSGNSGNVYVCNLPAKTSETCVLYINSSGKLSTGTGGGGGGLSATANGISDDGTTIRLGGTLTGDTSIDMNNQELYLVDADNCGMVISTSGATTCVILGETGVDPNNYFCITKGNITAYTEDSVDGSWGYFCLSDNDSIIRNSCSGSTNQRYVCLGNNFATLYASTGGGSTCSAAINVGDGIISVTGVQNNSSACFSGITYAQNYSTYFVDRSLVDKAYVDSVSGGLLSGYTCAVNQVVSIGDNALPYDTNGICNIAIGENALSGGTGFGDRNIAIGVNALKFGNGLVGNVAIGDNALGGTSSGGGNVAIGDGAMDATTSAGANSNVVVGSNALGGATSSSGNVVIGQNANCTGNPSSGVAIGQNAMAENSGTGNIGIGNSAMCFVSGNWNQAMGCLAMRDLTSGSANIGIGPRAAYRNTNGSSNVILGNYAGCNFTGSCNVFIGYLAGSGEASVSSCLIIGCSAAGCLIHGDFSTNCIYNGGDNASWDVSSDCRVKENVTGITAATLTLSQLNPITFDYTTGYTATKNWDENKRIGNYGFIAQEFETVFPTYVGCHSGRIDSGTTVQDFRTMNNGHLVPLLVKAIQELEARIDVLENQ